MKFEHTIEWFYKKCSERVKERFKKSNLTQKEIYIYDPKLISRIINNNRSSKNNRFLVCDSVLKNKYKDDDGTDSDIGLIPKLGFKDEKHVLWGTDEELETNLEEIFRNIIYDLLDSNIDYDIDIDYILCDYAPYARNSTYRKIITSKDNTYPTIDYGVIKEEIISSHELICKQAIHFLFLKCKEDFKNLIFNFTSTISSYKKIDSVFETTFIIAKFIPLLKNYIPNKGSLGIRVKNLIEYDLSKSAEMIDKAKKNQSDKFSDIQRALNRASSTYMVKLMEIHEQYIELIDNM